jgi:uncharacterized protein (DUF1684 family)
MGHRVPMKRMAGRLFCALLLFSAWVVLPAQPDEDRSAEIETWRAERQERLRGENGWLTLVGLHWLREGENRFGADEDLMIPLAAPGVASWAGTFFLQGEEVQVDVARGSTVTLNEEPLSGPTLVVDDSQGPPDVIGVERLRLTVIRRGEKTGIRVKDPGSDVRTGFVGIDYFEIDPSYRVEAVLKPFDEPQSIEIPTAVGTTATMLVPGQMEFSLNGATRVLHPLISEPGDTSLWLIFKDRTSGKESYGFRYLWVDLGENGKIDLDFNYAYNPPCAFTGYATCILPPKQNRLDTPIEAGERIYAH